MTEFIFLDLDDTILDFHRAERIALAKALREFGVEPTDSVLSRYHVINQQHWQRLERGVSGNIVGAVGQRRVGQGIQNFAAGHLHAGDDLAIGLERGIKYGKDLHCIPPLIFCGRPQNPSLG